MDFRSLRYFQVVAECGSYSRGSELLRISQPAVSRAIRNLEGELGRDLFKRNGRGVTLTEAGRVLLERSQMMLRQLNDTAEEIRSGGAGISGAIAVAIPPAAGYFLAPALVESFGRDYPNVFLKIVGGFSGYIHEWLVRGQVDLACLHDPLPQRGFEVEPLIREQVFVVGRRGTFPFDAERVEIAELARLPLILPSRPNASRRLLDSWTAADGFTVEAELEVDDHTIARALVRQGAGFSLLTKGAFKEDLTRGEVEARPLFPAAHWHLSLLTCPRSSRSDLAVVLKDRLRAITRDLVRRGTWPAELDGGPAPEG